MKFSNLLIQWYLQNKRDLPWRALTNPCNLALEIMLQQTCVAQGTPYFFAFRLHFHCFDFAAAMKKKC
jgi:A/G-specific adenine glycosylase